MKTPILGAAYVARSINAANNRMVNLYPEQTDQGGKEPGYLLRCPGLVGVNTYGGWGAGTWGRGAWSSSFPMRIGTGPVRGLWAFNDFMYAVCGSTLYKIDRNFGVATIGTVSGASGPVSMSDNGTQLFVACDGPSYIYNSITGIFGQITDSDFPGASVVGYLDGYFVFVQPNTQKLWVTSLLDGTTIDPLDFASAEGFPDSVVSMIIAFREVWLFGTTSTEVWYNAGSSPFPLQRIQGAFNELGCMATFSVAKLDNAIFWLGADARGKGIVYRANGYTGVRISTHAIEYAIQNYETITDAIGYTYQQEGHSFYMLIFPSADRTWCYDTVTQLWHERAGWNNGLFTRHRSNCQVMFNNQLILGDYEDGYLYTFSLDVFKDGDSTQKWLRSWRALPTSENNLKRSAQHSLQVDIESGTGLDGDVQGSDPQLMLRWSDDGGHTWSNYHNVSMGRIGQYYKRAIWRRLGMTLKIRDRVYELSGTDPVKIAIMGAELFVSPTNA